MRRDDEAASVSYLEGIASRYSEISIVRKPEETGWGAQSILVLSSPSTPPAAKTLSMYSDEL